MLRVSMIRALVCAGALATVASCPGSKTNDKPTTPEKTTPMPKPVEALRIVDTDQKGLLFKLTEGVEGAEANKGSPPVKATPLSEAETKAVLDRLPAVQVEADDQKEFAMRPKSMPAPRTGKTVHEQFPPPQQPVVETPQVGPLQVLRHLPDGDVPLAPHVSITFNQPMVAITSYAELEKLPIPAKLSPQPPGRWRWVGAKTLLFEPEGKKDDKGGQPPGRFPMATVYTVDIPAGTKSATGGALDKAVSFTFTTPTVTVKQFFPQGGPVRRDPVLLAVFDQEIDPQAVLATITLKAGSQSATVRAATEDEIKADASVKNLMAALDADAQKGRYVVFRAVDKLPVDTYVNVSIGPGTPSAEGPRKTAKAQEFSFRTYGPMRVNYRNCQSTQEQCGPGAAFTLQFTNPIDNEKFEKSMIKVEPAIPGLKLVAQGQYVTIFGQSKGRSTYKVTTSGTMPDAFGQTMEQDDVSRFVTVGAEKNLFSMGGDFVVLDPAAGPRFSVYSVNYKSLRVKAFKAGPDRWDAYHKFMREVWNRETYPPDPPLPLAYEELVKVKGEQDELTETRIDLTRALDKGAGSVLLLVEPPDRPKNRWEWTPLLVWVQVTQIGLDASVDHDELVAWATSLGDGKALDGVELKVQPSGITATTDASGTARMPLNAVSGEMLVARKGNDIAFLPGDTGYWSEGGYWHLRDTPDFMMWYVADDRQMYKPGEEARLKGWIRKIGGGEAGDVMGFSGVASRVAYVLRDSRGNEITKGDAPLTALGGFDFALKLPDNMNLGYAQVMLTATDAKVAGGSTYHNIQVQEFRRPEFEVSTSPSGGPYLLGEHATVTVNASYFAGGGLANADTTWYAYASPGYFSPPNRDEFFFGDQLSWWDSYRERNEGGEQSNQSFAAHTDSSGKHVVRVDFLSINPPRPMNLVAQATVIDVNRQAWTASSSLLVHPATAYVGLKTARPYLQKGDAIKVDGILVDLDGKAWTGQPIRMHAVRLDWDYDSGKGQYVTKEVDRQDCEVQSAEQAQPCAFKATDGGMYKVTAEVADDKGRRNQSRIEIWVAGGKLPPQREVTQEKVQLVPDKKEYHGGDTAEVLVIPPWSPAEALVTWRRAGIFKTERITIQGPSTTIKVPIEDGWTPDVIVQVDALGSAPRVGDDGEIDTKLPRRPAFASGSLSLPIPPSQRKLALAVTPRDEKLEPGGETVVHLALKDAHNEPVAGGEVAVVIVDESVLSLTGYRIPDPLPSFYPYRGPDTADYHLRRNVQLANPDDATKGRPGGATHGSGTGSGYGNGRNGGGGRYRALAAPSAAAQPRAPREEAAEKKEADEPEPDQDRRADSNASPTTGANKPKIAVRTDFRALAVFAPTVMTDSRGQADVPVKLPDNLTRYRVMAIATAGQKQFGAGEATITARKPIMVRPSPPRFLNFGDKFELPVVLQNQTDKPMEVSLAVRVTNADLTAGAGRRVTVPANDRVEVRFPASAMNAGIARFQFGAVAGQNGRWTDAAEVQLPVWTPATTEAFATYGVIDNGAISQPVKMPEGVYPQFGGLQISMASTNLQALTDAVLYLVRYPYECSEQMASRMMSVASLKDVLGAFHADGLPKPEAMVSSVAKDVELLRRLQNYDGGWGFWKHGEESWPFLTEHVAHALTRVKEKGFTVPEQMLNQAKPYLVNIEAHIPHWYGIDARRAIIAYSLYVRNRMGDRDTAKAKRLMSEAGGVEKLPLEAVGWIYPVLAPDKGSQAESDAIRKFLANRVEETAGAAHFVTSYGDGAYLLLHSDRRVDALFMEGLILDQPKNDVIPKLVEGLLGHRKAGHWENTQEDGWVLLALDLYFNTYEKVTPDFVARAWLGERYAGDHTFKGHTTERSAIDIPMQWLADNTKGAEQNLVLQKDGVGRLYYRIGMDYAPRDLRMPPRDNGFTVEREYAAVDDKNDVRRDPDGTWHVKAGARVRVRLTMVAQARRYHVALVDPLPAGFEPMNPALATTGVIPKDPQQQKQGGGGYYYWWGPWYEHQNMRDERVEAFTSLLWEGVHTYTYVARATTPGTFVAPPPKAEEMYHPETFGRGGSDRVIVE